MILNKDSKFNDLSCCLSHLVLSKFVIWRNSTSDHPSTVSK